MVHSSLTPVPDAGKIEIRGVRQNNLRGFDLDLPLGKLIVVSGPSGSGKSSLAFDTVYAEGQRRYVETFSPYTRQFFDRMDKPKVDSIRGIPPAIAIEQANPVKTTRSTVGTITEVNEYLRLLLPRVVQGFCPKCTREVRPETSGSIVDEVLAEHAGATLLVTFGVPVPPETKPADFFAFIQQQGYQRIWLNGEIVRIDEAGEKDAKAKVPRSLPAVVPVIQDRVVATIEHRSRICEAVDTALRFGKGKIAFVGTGPKAIVHPFSIGWHCAHCDVDIAPPVSGLFSFNHPVGACPRCRGFGRTIAIDLERAIPDRRVSLAGGAIKPFQTENGKECQQDLVRSAKKRKLDLNRPFEDLSKSDQEWVLYGERPGAPGEELWTAGLWYGVKGFFDWLESKTYKMHVRVLLARYRSYTVCPDCRGGRYQSATLNFRWAGKTLPEIAALPLSDLLPFVQGGTQRRGELADAATAMLLEEIASRLRYMAEVGLGYLTLDRPTRTLSGGELERVNLTTCLGASLVNTLFVLDEPSVGLHPRDTGRLISIMRRLRDKGNTLLVVEHEEAVIRAADHLVELGPGRGAAGGDLVYSGPLGSLVGTRPATLTGEYLSGRRSIPIPATRRTPAGWIEVKDAREHNLRGIDVKFPLGVLACISGVSGSGKSTLVHSVLFRHLQLAKGTTPQEQPGSCGAVLGAEGISQVILVDQSPLTRTPRSSPALYLGIFDGVRELFAATPAARAQGYTPSAFSFNSGDGRCERCSGSGWEKIEMQFLSDVFVRCPECEGRRYQQHVLGIKLDGKSIHQVLELTVSEAIVFFDGLDAGHVANPLRILEEVGLGYLTLGQPLNVLSGGESQRLKLVERLAKREETGALLILDEPTTGLHFDDVAMLIKVLDRLVSLGNSLLVIEHNLEVIKSADYVIDLGPEAGAGGGVVVAEGTPEEVAAVAESHTGRYLRGMLEKEGRGRRRPSRESAQYLPDEAEALLVAEVPPSYGNGRRASPYRNGTHIDIRGAREHNLKNVSLEIPRDQIVVVTGLSGSGKSTLAFDLLFAEGQRRFLDSMSAYARQFIDQLERPDVDSISGLPPTVAIEQRITRGGGKSTVATVTEVYHFLRLLWAKLGVQHCPKCEVAVEKQTLAAALKKAQEVAKNGRIRVLAPLVKARKGFHGDVAKWAVRHGYPHLLVDGKWERADQFPKLERFREHSIDVQVGERVEAREVEPVLKRALELGRGTAKILDARGKPHVVSTERCCPDCGQSFEELDPRLFSFNSPHGWCLECRGFGEVWKAYVNPRLDNELEIEMDRERQHEWLDSGAARPCPECDGARLNPTARAVRLGGKGIDYVTGLSARAACQWMGKLKFKGRQEVIATDILPEIDQRLSFMAKVGLDYLALSRSAKTLSGGESQRIRLAAQLGSNLRGVLYVLDEPTIGLHPRDNAQLLDTLDALKEKGNSLVIVEHDEDTMRRADHIIDLGPGAGRHGGEVVAQGTLEEIQRDAESATGRCLREPLAHPLRGSRRPLDTVTRWIEVQGANLHNLQDVTIRFPVGRLTVLTGISGSGKSSLMRGVLKPAMEAALKRGGRKKRPGPSVPWKGLTGAEHIETLYEVDQTPIGKTSRSTPATYIKVFDEIRSLFAQMPLSRMRGYTASRFSFNTEGGRCESCAGQGVIKVEMNFLPTSYLPCPDCGERRYNPPTLEVLYNDRSIGDVMEMTLSEATEFFRAIPKIHRPLQLLCDTGLGYLKLGQASPTLSGGEAQRIKLVSELVRGVGRSETARMRRAETGKSTLYLLEEPTIGLHLCDVQKLLDVLHRLVDEGHTVIVIEHHLNLIAEADYLVDIGPEAGAAGGEVVASGTPEKVAGSRKSRTAPFLRELLVGKRP